MRRKINKKLKRVHIFDKIWHIGKPNKKSDHAVIYGPDDKEYDLDQRWVSYLLSHLDGSYVDSQDGECLTNRWNLGRVKGYILSNIIDPGKWVFDTSTPPEVGVNVKVIYNNGTIKWIESFSGKFDNHLLEIKYEAPMRLNPKWLENHKESQFIWEEQIRTEGVLAWKIK